MKFRHHEALVLRGVFISVLHLNNLYTFNDLTIIRLLCYTVRNEAMKALRASNINIMIVR